MRVNEVFAIEEALILSWFGQQAAQMFRESVKGGREVNSASIVTHLAVLPADVATGVRVELVLQILNTPPSPKPPV